MERLVKRVGNEHAVPTEIDMDFVCALDKNTFDGVQRIFDRLCDLTDILGDDYDLDRLRELVEADREKRCVVLPCEVGRTVYMPFCDEIVKMRIGQFHINGYTSQRIWAEIDCDWAATKSVRWDLSFGKTVFLTREAAEDALKGEQNG